jgi:hypothetical protein
MKVWSLLIVAVLCSCSAAQPQAQPPQEGLKPGMTTSNEYIVTLDKDVQFEELKTQLADYGLIIVKDLGRKRYLVRFEQDPGLGELKKQQCFKTQNCSIQPNFKYKHF